MLKLLFEEGQERDAHEVYTKSGLFSGMPTSDRKTNQRRHSVLRQRHRHHIDTVVPYHCQIVSKTVVCVWKRWSDAA